MIPSREITEEEFLRQARIELEAAKRDMLESEGEAMNTDTPEPEAGPITEPDALRSEIAKVLVDFRDGLGDGIEEAVERVLEVTEVRCPTCGKPKGFRGYAGPECQCGVKRGNAARSHSIGTRPPSR